MWTCLPCSPYLAICCGLTNEASSSFLGDAVSQHSWSSVCYSLAAPSSMMLPEPWCMSMDPTGHGSYLAFLCILALTFFWSKGKGGGELGRLNTGLFLPLNLEFTDNSEEPGRTFAKASITSSDSVKLLELCPTINWLLIQIMSLKYSAPAATQHTTPHTVWRENVYTFQIQEKDTTLFLEFSKHLSRSVSDYSREDKYHQRSNKEHTVFDLMMAPNLHHSQLWTV